MYYMWVAVTAVFAAFVLFRHGKDLLLLTKLWHRSDRTKQQKAQANVAKDLILFSQSYNRFAPGLELQAEEVDDSFLRYSLKTFLSGAVRGPELLRSLRQSIDEQYEQEMNELIEVRGIQKFLPAVGWMISMIGLAYFFKAPELGEQYVVQAGAVFSAVVGAVFYGLGMIYVVIEPLSKSLNDRAYWNRRRKTMIVEGVSLLMKRKSVFETYEHLNMTLCSEEKIEFENVLPELKVEAA